VDQETNIFISAYPLPLDQCSYKKKLTLCLGIYV